MKRVIKPEGAYHVEIEDVPLPEIRQTEVLIRTERTLISRGSEIWRRYVREEAIDHQRMGYSLAGTIVQVGAQVDDLSMGERVAALAPHAEYVAVEVVNAGNKTICGFRYPMRFTSEAATFWPLTTSSVLWMRGNWGWAKGYHGNFGAGSGGELLYAGRAAFAKLSRDRGRCVGLALRFGRTVGC